VQSRREQCQTLPYRIFYINSIHQTFSPRFSTKKTLQSNTLCKVFFLLDFMIGLYPKSFGCYGQTPFTHSGHFPLEFHAAGNINKILVLLSFYLCLQGFQRKKDLVEFLPQGLILYLVLPLV